MKTELNIDELRRWSAGVCGYAITYPPTANVWVRKPHMSRSSLWQPEQNIVQAFEVAKSVVTYGKQKRPPCDFALSVSQVNDQWTARMDYRGPVVWQDTLELAVLLAAKAAWESAQ